MRLEKSSLSHAHRIIAITRAIFMAASEQGHRRPQIRVPSEDLEHVEAGDTVPAVFFAEEISAQA